MKILPIVGLLCALAHVEAASILTTDLRQENWAFELTIHGTGPGNVYIDGFWAGTAGGTSIYSGLLNPGVSLWLLEPGLHNAELWNLDSEVVATSSYFIQTPTGERPDPSLPLPWAHVPDSGSTAVLLLGGLCLMSAVHRFTSAKV